MRAKSHTIIELEVLNHPGVMSHITGLFSRRGYNLEGILCGAIGTGATSVVYLLIQRNEQSPQVLLQLFKLHDVLNVVERPGFDCGVFGDIPALFGCADGSVPGA
jgi:acetolactate synthase-1/3 small subunit